MLTSQLLANVHLRQESGAESSVLNPVSPCLTPQIHCASVLKVGQRIEDQGLYRHGLAISAHWPPQHETSSSKPDVFEFPGIPAAPFSGLEEDRPARTAGGPQSIVAATLFRTACKPGEQVEKSGPE